MAGDPYKIFREESDAKREALKMIWPDLYQSLVPDPRTGPAWGCGFVHGDGRFRPVKGRLWLNGAPACEECLRRSDRPGGYPLRLTDPKEWSR